jgi:hypothetical protein
VAAETRGQALEPVQQMAASASAEDHNCMLQLGRHSVEHEEAGDVKHMALEPARRWLADWLLPSDLDMWVSANRTAMRIPYSSWFVGRDSLVAYSA